MYHILGLEKILVVKLLVYSINRMSRVYWLSNYINKREYTSLTREHLFFILLHNEEICLSRRHSGTRITSTKWVDQTLYFLCYI